ncbi:16679_t:CDS:1, partial [Dentiscutata heterogama]
IAYNEIISDFGVNIEFSSSIYDPKSNRFIYNSEPTCDFVVTTNKNKEIGLDSSKKKLREEIIFLSWEEIFDTLKLYSQYKEFKLKKNIVRKTLIELYENKQYW